MTLSPLRLSVTGRQTRITVEHVPCSLDGSRAAITRFLPSWIAARFPRVVIAHQSDAVSNSVGLQDARGPYFRSQCQVRQDARRKLSDLIHLLLRLLFHVPKHGAGASGNAPKVTGEIRNVEC